MPKQTPSLTLPMPKMKKIICLLLILFTGIVNAQVITDFVGSSFKNKLLDASADGNHYAKNSSGNWMTIDVNDDNEISQDEALLVYELYISNMSIQNIVGIQYFMNLREFDCSNNSIYNVDFSALVNLKKVNVKQNELSTVDVSNSPVLEELKLDNNNLISIYAKNGANEVITFTGGQNDGLVYICADEGQVVDLEDLNTSSPPNYVVNSYCTLTPGGAYKTIKGKLIFDATNNGIEDTDVPQPNAKIKCTMDTKVFQTTTNSNGEYAFYVPASTTGNFTLTPVLDTTNSSTLFTALTPVVDVLNASTQYVNDFPLTSLLASPDIEIMVQPIELAMPGDQAVYKVVYKNKGTKTTSGIVSFKIDDSKCTLATIPAGFVLDSGFYNGNFTDLKPFETRSFNVLLNINPSTGANPVAIGDIMNFTMKVTQSGLPIDIYPSDNLFVYKQTIVPSYNSNRIECLEGSSVASSEVGKYLHYAINFENTGNATANNVVIKSVFDATKFDVNSLQILDESHPLDLQIENEKALYHMRNISLGGPGGQGTVLLKIKTNNTIPTGTTVSVDTKIFFDYTYNTNTSPLVITTNTANTTFQTLSVSVNSVDSSISVYPNPTSSIINIESDDDIRTVELYDIYGRLLQTNLTASEKTILDISQRTEGTYFLKITSDKGQKVEKIVKK